MRPFLFSLSVLIGGWWSSAEAAVVLNEVAWMGTEESYLCEWIELYNSGSSAVSLDDWTMQINDGPLKAFQDGEFNNLTIPAGEYFVVERLVASCPDPVVSVDDGTLAFGSIPNSNATIRMWQDLEGTVLADQLASGEDWGEIGGDNETKETAQYTTGGWVTGGATPGQANISIETTSTAERSESDTQTAEQTTATEQTRTSGGSSATTLTLAEQSAALDPLTITINYPNTVYAGHPVTFTAEVDGRGRGVRNSLRYDWNFGDMTVATGPEAEHVYEFPGEYVVSLHAEYFEYSATKEHTVVVLPVTLAMNITEDGHLHIHNTAQYDVDVSQYELSTKPPMTFPDRSYITARGTITVPNAKLGTHAAELFLQDREGAVVSTAEPYASPQANTPERVVAGVSRAAPTVTMAAASEDRGSERTTTATAPPQRTVGVPTAEAATDPLDTKGASGWWHWYALLGLLISIGIGAIIVSAPRSRTTPVHDVFAE